MSEADRPVQIEQLDSVQDVERLLLEIANAIQRFITERNTLRIRVDNLERELTRMRQQTKLIHDGYRRLSTEFVTQLQSLDSEVANLFREPPESAHTRAAEQQFAEGDTSNSPPVAKTSPFLGRSDR
jgi:predicted RNase H-like nuclease (RuvC/YqgF family)